MGGLKTKNKKKIYLFRHGETDWNKIGRFQYSIDIELNETGLKQAKLNADLLKDKGIQHIYSSPLKRAYKTGEVLAQQIGVDMSIVDELRELKGGIVEGKTKEEIIEMFGLDQYEDFSYTKNGSMDFGFPGGETKRQARDRFCNAVLNICKTTSYDTIGISSHGYVLRELCRALDYEDSGVKNCEYIEADFDDGEIKILKRVAHED